MAELTLTERIAASIIEERSLSATFLNEAVRPIHRDIKSLSQLHSDRRRVMWYVGLQILPFVRERVRKLSPGTLGLLIWNVQDDTDLDFPYGGETEDSGTGRNFLRRHAEAAIMYKILDLLMKRVDQQGGVS